MLHRRDYIWLIRKALEEDIGPRDVTTYACIPEETTATAFICAKEDLIFCGGQIAEDVFKEVDPNLRVDIQAPEGEWVLSGDILMTVSGRVSPMLIAERTALNFLQRMCGIATTTASYVAAIAGTPARIIDTRKTLPGWRVLDKYSVRVGGGYNHRFGLYDGVLIKDNHIAATGSIAAAISKARSASHHLIKIEVEVTSLEEAIEAVDAGADILLLDNMSPEEVSTVVDELHGRCKLEVSGGITLENVQYYAETGVDYISIGALTHSAKASDISMTLSNESAF